MERLCKVQKLETAYSLIGHLNQGMKKFKLHFVMVSPELGKYEVWTRSPLRLIEREEVSRLIRAFVATGWRHDRYECCKCGESGLGTALDGKIYCHRRICIDWKLELRQYRLLHQLWCT